MCGHVSNGFAQTDSIPNYKARITAMSIGGGVVYSSTMLGLNELWYKDYPRSPFHGFNDNDEWLQIDKVGHTMSTYYLGIIGHSSLRWAGVEERKAVWIGGMVGSMYMTGIEVLDGFSQDWGFSWGDQLANFAGSGAFIAQQLAWEEQRIKLKFSSNPTQYSRIRPALLGSTTMERIFKDYNGQTYWASINVDAFFPNAGIPPWLCVSAGYGGSGMIRSRMIEIQDAYSDINQHYRQFYLSLDIDLTKIPTRSPWVRALTKAVGFIKIPAPTIEWNQGKSPNYYWLFF